MEELFEREENKSRKEMKGKGKRMRFLTKFDKGK